jgi:hypothetical protein
MLSSSWFDLFNVVLQDVQQRVIDSDCVLEPSVHALSTNWAVHMRCIPGGQAPRGTESHCHHCDFGRR